jgi:hypothetical protein
MEDDFVPIHTLSNRFEADLLMDALQREGIPALLRSFEETPYDGLFVHQRGWGQILALADHASQAKEIISVLLQDVKTRRLYEDPAETDPLLWEKLRQADSTIIGSNAQVRYDASIGAYAVPFLNGVFHCYPELRTIESAGPESFVKRTFQFYLVILHYLLEAQSAGLSGKWVSEQDLPGGNFFFQGPHQIQTGPLLKLMGYQADLLRIAAEKLGGVRIASGDMAYRFWALPRVPVLFILWVGDDEFKPTLHVRMDATIPLQLRSLDTIWALLNTVCQSLYAAAKSSLAEGTRCTDA